MFISNMTNEVLCVYYDCSGFDFHLDRSVLDIQGPVTISRNNKVGKIENYFQNYKLSFEIKFDSLDASSDLSILGLKKKYCSNIISFIFYISFIFSQIESWASNTIVFQFIFVYVSRPFFWKIQNMVQIPWSCCDQPLPWLSSF